VERPLTLPPDLALRRPTEADHQALARLIPQWWGEKRPTIRRLWVRHFGSTSAMVERPDGRVIGAGIAFVSQDQPALGVVLAVAVAPGFRRRGVGRAIVAAVEETLAARGVRSVEAVIWSGNRTGVRFFDALGYAPIAESMATPLYGVPAIENYDGEGEERSVFMRELPAG
jgi:ribosomal protein S18 acetylase RimI-like enzyme